MDLLTKPISSFSFDDVVSFCKEKHREGYQIDYKRGLTSKSLAKHFAAFANSKGGTIIIGVEEGKNGLPIKWEGVKNNAKDIEKLHQWATDVSPLPPYEVYPTDEKKGKIFILVRIFEGERTPYYVQNDPKIYIRTGNITDPVDLASPEALELLVNKKDRARKLREICLKRANSVYDASLERAEQERQRLIATEKENYQIQREKAVANGEPIKDYVSSIIQNRVGENISPFKLYIQPYYPADNLTKPSDIMDKREEIRFISSNGDFPDLNLKPIQDGVLCFKWVHSDGDLKCHQLFSNGFLQSIDDVLRTDEHGRWRIYISLMAVDLFVFLKAAMKFYNQFGYQGGLVGSISLSNIKDARVKRIVPNGWRGGLFWDDENETPIMDEYKWNINTDTSNLSNEESFQSYFISLINEMYWSFGYASCKEDLIKAFLKDNKWLV